MKKYACYLPQFLNLTHFLILSILHLPSSLPPSLFRSMFFPPSLTPQEAFLAYEQESYEKLTAAIKAIDDERLQVGW